MKYGITSGYANPIHPGHIDCFRLSKEHCDYLWVIVNNDKQAEMKRGVPSFQDEQYRLAIVKSIRYVDYAMIAVDRNGSVCESIKVIYDKIKSEDPEAQIIFTKGGDRFSGNIPEVDVCKELGIEIIDGLGAKTHSSSEVIKALL